MGYEEQIMSQKKIYTYERFFPTDGGYCYCVYYPLSVFATRRKTVYEQLAVCCVRWMFLFKCSLVQLNEQTNALSSRIEGHLYLSGHRG